MNHGFTGGKRQREANRERKRKDKEERLRRNRQLRANGIDPSIAGIEPGVQTLPEVKLEDIVVSGVAPRGPKGSNHPVKLFVGGLSWDTDGDMLKAAFGSFGPLAEATVVLDRATGKSRGFGFVTFENPLDALQAAKQMDGAEVDGRRIKVNPAEPR